MILACGDAFVDRYTWGTVNRLSPDAPVPVVLVEREEDREGGVLNAAANIRAMGGDCVAQCSVSPPIVKHRIMGRGQHIVRVDYDTPQIPVDEEEFQELAGVVDTVVFCDYGKGSLANIEKLIDLALPNKILVDPKGHDWTRYAGVDLIKPNRDEMREMVGGWSSPVQLIAKMEKLRKQAKIGAILLTMAKEGMVLVHDGGANVFPTQAKDIVCPSGAGEAVICAMALMLDRGSDLVSAAEVASKAGAIACSRFGTTLVSEGELFDSRTHRDTGRVQTARAG